MQRRRVDRHHLAFARRTGLTGAEFRLGFKLAGREALLLALLLGQQFGRGLLLPLGGYLFEFLLFGFGLGSLQGGFGFDFLLFQIGFPSVADQRVEGIDRRNSQRVGPPQRIGKLGTAQRVEHSGPLHGIGPGEGLRVSGRVRHGPADRQGIDPVNRPSARGIGGQKRQ